MRSAVNDMKEKKFWNHAALNNVTRPSETDTQGDSSKQLDKVLKNLINFLDSTNSTAWSNLMYGHPILCEHPSAIFPLSPSLMDPCRGQVLAAAKAAVSAARDAQRVRAGEARRRQHAAVNLTFVIPPLLPPNATATTEIPLPLEASPQEPPAPAPAPEPPAEPPAPTLEPATEPEPGPAQQEPAEPAAEPEPPAEPEPAPEAQPAPEPEPPAQGPLAEAEPAADSPAAAEPGAAEPSSPGAAEPLAQAIASGEAASAEAASEGVVGPEGGGRGAAGEAAEPGADGGAGSDGAEWTLQPFAGTSAERAVVWRRVRRKLLPGVPALPWRPLWQTAAGPQNYTAGGTFRHFDGRLMRVLNVTHSGDAGRAGGAVVLPSLGGGWVLQDAGLLHGQGPDPDDPPAAEAHPPGAQPPPDSDSDSIPAPADGAAPAAEDGAAPEAEDGAAPAVEEGAAPAAEDGAAPAAEAEGPPTR
jgi:outer membrane biosynthesis protein TonB